MDEKNRQRRSVVIIREVYDSENANEIFEQQLEQALVNSVDTIIIEPYKLGDETSRWIAVGNCLHKSVSLLVCSMSIIHRMGTYKQINYFCTGCVSWLRIYIICFCVAGQSVRVCPSDNTFLPLHWLVFN